MNTELVNSVITTIKEAIDSLLARYKLSDKYYEPIIEEALEKPYIFKEYKYSHCLDNLKNHKYDRNKTDKYITTLTLKNAIEEYNCLQTLKFADVFNDEQLSKKQPYISSQLTDLIGPILYFISDFERINTRTNLSLDSFVQYITNYIKVNDSKDVPKLSSIHKMKGGEGDRIFIYNYNKFPYTWEDQSDDDKQQELNLQYVAITRAKKELFLCVDTENEKAYGDCCKKLISNRITFSRL